MEPVRDRAQSGQYVSLGRLPVCPAWDARASKAVIYRLKPRHLTPRLLRWRWQLKAQRDIVDHEGLRLSEPRITAWT